MKKILVTIFFYFLVTTYALSFENIITSLIKNDDSEQEIEVVVSGEKMFLPCKYILSALSIPYKENHVEKSLTTKNTVIKNNAVFINGAKQNYQVYFVKNGISGIKNEYFIPAEALSKITGENITSDSGQLLAFINPNQPESKPIGFGDAFVSQPQKIVPKAYENVTLPNKKGRISLDSIAFNNNLMSDSYSQVYREAKNNNFLFNNNSRMTLNGRLNSGTYKVDLGTNSYTNNIFSFSGISPQYKNRFANYDYVLGKADSWDFGKNSIASDVMGLQIKDHVEKTLDYKDIQGYVDPKNTVKVYINNDFEKEISTYGGYYSLKDIYYNKGKVEKVKIEELLADGAKRTVFQREFTKKSQEKPIPKNDLVFGISGTQNRLWASNGYIYQSNTQKFVSGAKFRNEISDKLSFENFFLTDKIISMPQTSTWGQSILSNRKYLNFTTMRNINMLEGQTYMGAFDYQNNDKMNSRFSFGASNSIAQDIITKDGTGVCLSYENNYKFNDNNSLKASLFNYSPQFYSAGSSSGSGGFLADRAGASINANTKLKNTDITGAYSKYNSNMGHYYEGGLLGVDEYNFISRTTFKKLPSIILKTNGKSGSNQLAQIQSNSYEISGNKKIKCAGITAGIRRNDYSNNYNSGDFSSYKSSYSNTYANLNTPIGKKFGSANLEHEIVETKSDSTLDKYNTFRVGYSVPTIKTCNLNVMAGYRYTGLNKGLDFGVGLIKRLKSGSSVGVNYRFNRSPGYIIENMYLPSTMRHSITVDFSELYGLSDNKLQPLGSNNMNNGFVQVIAFLDSNQNGIQDKGEINIENITVKIKDEEEVMTTDKHGRTKLKSEEAGIHQIQIFEDELPTLVSVHSKTDPLRIIKVEQNEKTQVFFGLKSSVGNINGTITVKDEYDQQLKVEDLVVSALSELGSEVCYTNPDKDGTFSMSGLSPGKYKICIDKEFQDNYHIYPDKKTENYIVEIPPEYKKYVTIDNVNLVYIYKL